MLATANAALALTAHAGQETEKGSRRIQDYLPKEELDRFLKNAAATTGRSAGASTDANGMGAEHGGAYEANKLDKSNVGYQMLQQSGWRENTGLGAASEGIVNPIAASGAGAPRGGGGSSGGPVGAGVGVAATHEVAAGDDEFEQFRKRNMLAYRFRPNPLNNPRRSYY